MPGAGRHQHPPALFGVDIHKHRRTFVVVQQHRRQYIAGNFRNLALHQQRGEAGAIGGANEQIVGQTALVEGQARGNGGDGGQFALDPRYQQEAVEQRHMQGVAVVVLGDRLRCCRLCRLRRYLPCRFGGHGLAWAPETVAEIADRVFRMALLPRWRAASGSARRGHLQIRGGPSRVLPATRFGRRSSLARCHTRDEIQLAII